MKILVAVLLVLALALISVCVAALRQPDEFRVTRSTRISASTAAVFAELNDFHVWPEWSPWAKLDPSMRTSYDGPPNGVGAGYAWSGNSKVGQGAMRIVESVAASQISIQLDFIKPFRASNRTTFTLTPESDGTRVTWTMAGRNQFVAKVMGLFMDMDKLIGADFERGLSNLKLVTERGASS